MIVAWLGVAAPVREEDIDSVACLGSNYAGLRVRQFLGGRGLLALRGERPGMDEAAARRLAATAPGPFRADIDVWIKVLRGDGSRPSRPLTWRTVRRYVGYVLPTLARWHEDGVTDLGQITPEDIAGALRQTPFPSDRSAHSGLRSLFRALRRERRIFRDPARRVSMPAAQRIPRPLPADQVAGLLDRARSRLGAAMIALIAIHGVRPTEILHLLLDDLDRSRGTLTVRRPGSWSLPDGHVVHLDEVALRLLASWLTERHRRWPRCSNPHLFVSARTAMNTDHPPINRYCLLAQVRPTGTTPARLWTDRILDEADYTADPVHLMHLFGLHRTTAIKYVRAAHPGKFMIDPAQA